MFKLKSNKNENHLSDIEKKFNHKSAPKTIRLLLAELIHSFIEYTSELTYFSINAFQTSSLKRVQTITLTRFDNYCVPHTCAFYYSLNREYEEFIERMKKLCKRTQNTFLDIRSARIHYPESKMFNIPDTYRLLNILKCNIERLRNLKQIHQDLGHDLLLPNDQLFLSLDLLVTNFQLILCELDNQVRFRDVMILQTFVKDIFLQLRVVLTWLYPAIKMAAYRIGDPNKQFAVKRCKNIEKFIDKTFPLNNNNNSIIKTTDDRSQSVLQNNSSEQELNNVNDIKQNSVSYVKYNTSLLFIKRSCILNKSEEVSRANLLLDNDKIWYKEKINEIQQKLDMHSVRIFIYFSYKCKNK
ncbi:unnamed protein product [Adineta steineri]|uniref:Uncharacterized protein n=1 Tax=Adineta steineri TaxID=433720 RepID=A0A813X927_9BILA|nr:unnamed protein product [Adineta steineri]CAF0868188.1 unnamed protein product [Adineta steineri]